MSCLLLNIPSMDDMRRLRRSTDVRLKAPPPVTPYERVEEDDPELDIEEQELELDEENAILAPKPRGGMTIGQLVALISIVLIALAVVIVIIYLATRTTSANTSGAALTAGLGESCSTKSCTPPLICQSSTCVGDLHGPCTTPGTCRSGLTCTNNQCTANLGQMCSFSSDCAPGLVCSSQQICVPSS
jgi:hypothetical protein